MSAGVAVHLPQHVQCVSAACRRTVIVFFSLASGTMDSRLSHSVTVMFSCFCTFGYV